MDVREGEVFFVDKPLHWTSFNVVDRFAMEN
jgi:tRNA U55 pseudouridine synthase TruB